MPPSPIPAPLPPWARTLLQVAPFISAGLQEVLQYFGEAHDATSSTPSQWRRVQLTAELIGNVNSRDRASTTLDFAKMTAGGVDPNWTAGDETALRNGVLGMITDWASYMTALAHWTTASEYRMQFNPLNITPPLVPSGPPIWTNTYNLAGTQAPPSLQPPQVAATTTDKTAYPKHWGRNYWPYPDHNKVSPTGHWTAAMCDGFGSALAGRYATLMAAQIFPVTVVTQIQKAPARGLLTVTQLQMDDVPDVIRRRRPSQTTHRYDSAFAATQPA